MKILLIGSTNVNPERFLPITESHEVFGIWQSRGLWGHSVRASQIKEIPVIKFNEVKSKKIDIMWNLLSPWDGIDLSLKLMCSYPEIPLIRQSQGGATAWWNNPRHPKNRDRGVNYSFIKYKNLLECADGLMFNSMRYRNCFIDQGVNIKDTPFLLTNGMAFNYDLITDPIPEKLSSRDGEPHISVIGRARHDPKFFAKNKIHVHYHSIGKKTSTNPFVHYEKYIGDGGKMSQPISMKELLSYKRKTWFSTFARYDAGLMHLSNRELNLHKGVDICVPGRVNTYIMAGLPPIVINEESAIVDFLAESKCALSFNDGKDLISKLRDFAYMHKLQKQVLKIRKTFSMQHELPKITEFFEGFLG